MSKNYECCLPMQPQVDPRYTEGADWSLEHGNRPRLKDSMATPGANSEAKAAESGLVLRQPL